MKTIIVHRGDRQESFSVDDDTYQRITSLAKKQHISTGQVIRIIGMMPTKVKLKD